MKQRLLKIGVPILVISGLSFALAACNQSATTQEQKTSISIEQQYLRAQPVPQFKYSQIRQTLIDIETAQANGIQTTSFFFNLGVTAPIQSCPSLGFPVATTDEITNPLQTSNPGDSSSTAIGNLDPNGIYTGDSTGTYVICVAPDGSTYAQYWEGYVDSVSGPAVWDTTTNAIKLTGPSSQVFNAKHS